MSLRGQGGGAKDKRVPSRQKLEEGRELRGGKGARQRCLNSSAHPLEKKLVFLGKGGLGT